MNDYVLAVVSGLLAGGAVYLILFIILHVNWRDDEDDDWGVDDWDDS